MGFQSIEFLAFLAAAALVCPALERRRAGLGRLALLALSIGRYLVQAGAGALAVLAVGTAVTLLALRRGRNARAGAAVWHIGVLLVLKYAAFFTGGAVQFAGNVPGLSFFTFAQLWMLKDAPDISGWELALHAWFFPTVTSGPIWKSDSFLAQVRGEGFLRPGAEDIAAGLYALSVGLAKKTLLADNLGRIVANGWANPVSAVEAWMVILAYTLQLYLDFSGYCDMASGAARLFGLRLPRNFDSPYRALSVAEFWKRWHITLTSFLRQCVYFPLGGSRGGQVKTCRNILLVFLISGLWHGAGWTFLIWGALHGLAQIAERLLGQRRDALPAAVRWVITFGFVNVAWVFFRAPSVSAALRLLRAAVTADFRLSPAIASGVLESEIAALRLLVPALGNQAPLLAAAALLLAGMIVSLWPVNALRRWDDLRPSVRLALGCGLMGAWSVVSFSGVSTFIYANF